MKTLVIGATGFIGGHVVRHLLAAGHRVRVFVRRTSDPRRVPAGDVEVCVGDLRDRDAVGAAVNGVDWVFHVAGKVSFWNGDAEELRAQHVDGTAAVVAACGRGRARLIYTSSVAALGRPRPDGAIGDEGTTFDWPSGLFAYGRAKRDAERAISGAVNAGLDAVTVMPASTFGPGDYNLSAARFIADLDSGRILGYPAGGLTIAHVDAVAAGHVLAAQSGRSGERYILGGEHLSYRKLLHAIARQLGRRRPAIPIPSSLLAALGTAGSVVSVLFRRDLGLNHATATFGRCKLYYSSAKAERELRYRTLPAEDAIRSACQWYLSTYRDWEAA